MFIIVGTKIHFFFEKTRVTTQHPYRKLLVNKA